MIYFPGGGAGLRIGFSSYISVLPALLFGPAYGGVTMGIMDVLSFIIKPDGGFLLPITLTAIGGGILRGVLWNLFKNKRLSIKPYLIFFGILILAGVINIIMMSKENFYGNLLDSFNKKAVFVTYVPLIFGILGTLLLVLNKALSKSKFYSEKFLNVLSTLMIANIIVTTVNTVLLMIFIPSLSKLAFSFFFIPRLAEEIANTSIQAFVVSYLLKLTDKLNIE